MLLSLWTSHLLIEQKSIVGKRLVVVGAQLEDPYPLPQCIIDVLGVRKQLLILRGLEREYMKHVSFSKNSIEYFHLITIIFKTTNTHHTEGSGHKRWTCYDVEGDRIM